MNTALETQLTWSLLRREQNRTATLLPVLAFAVSACLTLVVAGGASSFFEIPGDLALLYRSLAGLALVVLVFPLVTLAHGAARLSMRRRDERLSSLRLLGASRGFIVRTTLAEAGLLALAGVTLGALAYAALMPAFGLLSFAGTRLGWRGIWVGWPVLVGVVVGLVVLGMASAAFSLARVVVTPLGVRQRQQAIAPHKLRLILGSAFLVAAMVAMGSIRTTAGFGLVVLAVVALVAVGGAPAAISLIGPWLLRTITAKRVDRAGRASDLLAARSILEDPRAAWRLVAPVSMVTFVGVIGGSGMAMASKASTRPEDVILANDITQGVLLTIGLAFVTMTCSVALSQAAAALDRHDLWVGLDRAGTPRRVMARARAQEVMAPLKVVLVFSIIVPMVLAFPVVGIAAVTNPLALTALAGVLVLGVLLVRLGAAASEPVVSAELARSRRAE